jgi:hypothetical protein
MFERQRAGQHRGGAGILTPVLQRLKMLIKYDAPSWTARSSTQFSRHDVESPYDHQMTAGAGRAAAADGQAAVGGSAAGLAFGPGSVLAQCPYRCCSEARRSAP